MKIIEAYLDGYMEENQSMHHKEVFDHYPERTVFVLARYDETDTGYIFVNSVKIENRDYYKAYDTIF